MPVGVGGGDRAGDSYLGRVKRTPAPSTFGKIWTEWQFPPNANIPLFNMGRPFGARVSIIYVSMLFNPKSQHHMHNPCLDRLCPQKRKFLIAALPACAGQGVVVFSTEKEQSQSCRGYEGSRADRADLYLAGATCCPGPSGLWQIPGQMRESANSAGCLLNSASAQQEPVPNILEYTWEGGSTRYQRGHP